MLDLAALTAKTGNEFAMFTRKGERLVVRGNSNRVLIDERRATALRGAGYRWSGHTHTGFSDASLTVSNGDRIILSIFGQKNASVYNAVGKHEVFNAKE